MRTRAAAVIPHLVPPIAQTSRSDGEQLDAALAQALAGDEEDSEAQEWCHARMESGNSEESDERGGFWLASEPFLPMNSRVADDVDHFAELSDPAFGSSALEDSILSRLLRRATPLANSAHIESTSCN